MSTDNQTYLNHPTRPATMPLLMISEWLWGDCWTISSKRESVFFVYAYIVAPRSQDLVQEVWGVADKKSKTRGVWCFHKQRVECIKTRYLGENGERTVSTRVLCQNSAQRANSQSLGIGNSASVPSVPSVSTATQIQTQSFCSEHINLFLTHTPLLNYLMAYKYVDFVVYFLIIKKYSENIQFIVDFSD